SLFWTGGLPSRALAPARRSGTAARLELVERARPVLMEQARERAIGEQPSRGLAGRTVVGFVVSVADPLNRRAADRTGRAIATMNRHRGSKGRHVFGESVAGLGAQPRDPFAECVAGRLVEAFDFPLAELAGHRDRRETRAKQNLVRIGIADTTDYVRIGQRALQCMVGGAQPIDELRERGRERLEGVAAQPGEFASGHDPKGRTTPGPGLGQREPSMV